MFIGIVVLLYETIFYGFFCTVYGQESFLYEVVFFMGVFVADDVKCYSNTRSTRKMFLCFEKGPR